MYLILRRYQNGRRKAPALAVFSASMTALKILLWAASHLIIIAGLLKLAFE
jgi:phosphatidylserine synthase